MIFRTVFSVQRQTSASAFPHAPSFTKAVENFVYSQGVKKGEWAYFSRQNQPDKLEIGFMDLKAATMVKPKFG